MPKAKHPIQEFLGVRYYRKPSGYCKSDWAKHGGKYMHRVVWEHHNGPIPEGHHIHHINGDKADNRVENLECLDGGNHASGHGIERHATPAGHAANMGALAKARTKAAEWHGSDAGRRWHSEHGKRTWVDRERVEMRCAHCDKPYFGFVEMAKRGFCSTSCQGAARKASGVDDENRVCCECGSEFRANKYVKTKTCSKACWKAVLSRAKREGVRPHSGG